MRDAMMHGDRAKAKTAVAVRHTLISTTTTLYY